VILIFNTSTLVMAVAVVVVVAVVAVVAAFQEAHAAFGVASKTIHLLRSSVG
jgi:uncharacterized protein YoxC